MANLYDLKKFDLNLLVIFECIYQHLSISKAAETLFITPSAVSQSLQRLRNQLNDPLFIRSGKGITPTTVGVNLHKHLEQNLNALEQTINIMHGTSLQRNFIVYCPQILTPTSILAPIKLLIREHNYEVEFHDMLLSSSSAEDLLAYRKADLVFSLAPVSHRSIVCTPYKNMPIVLTCRQNHPRIRDSISREEFENEKFSYLISEEPGIKTFQAQSEQLIPERKIAFRCDSVFSMITMIAESNLLGFMPEIAFEHYRDLLKLKKVKTDFILPSLNIYMLYNRVALNNELFASFIEKISDKDFEYD